ncbi:unnamed protein product [Vitrella brassicaformis CCMP3155]|uniref:Uncharacterized protein n=1 Tax=Vitrella brassicaformis (strain CCMP3155) TaxID=1169540 RepID=A0A0G4FW60_VITBC|nr:unnamed protein product [Vitrella brassicaformis CCMP3155]|eukprot:CEM19439.1 unnamed protein product [Vitrella brassicaformis CCMP3155]
MQMVCVRLCPSIDSGVWLGIMAQPSSTTVGRSSASQAPPAVPLGCKGLDDVEIVPDEGVSVVSRQLLEGCIRRTITDVSQVTQLIRQGADPRAIGSLRVRGTTAGPIWRYSCLCFAIDSPTESPSLTASGAYDSCVPVALPQWSSRQLQRDIISALIDGGADINAGGSFLLPLPVLVAIAAGNLPAVEALLARQANVRGIMVMELPYIPDDAPPATREYENNLMSIYRRLIQHDGTLAAERSGGWNLVHSAARSAAFSQLFIGQYLTLISPAAEMIRATNNVGATPLHVAAGNGLPWVLEWLCRQLTPDDVNIERPNRPNQTPLAIAAERLDPLIQQQQQQGDGQRERLARWIREYQTAIRTLLRGGAAPSSARMPTDTEKNRRRRQLVLAEYATVLNELSEVVMSAINAGLAPQRDHSMRLARLLPLAPHHDGAHPYPAPSNLSFGPHEAEAIGWKIGAFLYEPSAAVAAIDDYLIGETLMRRRVRAAVSHFVKSAATQSSCNREVVGGPVGPVQQEVEEGEGQQRAKRAKVSRPPLQCFAIRSGADGVLTGVREVVHRARLDEAAQHGVEGVVKGFNEHLGDQDCQFQWEQLGRIDRTTGLFVSLGLD